MMKLFFFVLALTVQYVTAFPWVSDMPGVDNSLLQRQVNKPDVSKRQNGCPFNPDHKGAAPYTSEFSYTGAKNGLPGTGKGGIKVPADGDTDHMFEAPGDNDIRGPCPGLNTAANHHFLSHDGITTFEELVDAQQNLYNVGWDLAVLLAVLGVGLDGDILTGKLSIGCDATSRTSGTGGVLGREPGLNGHNKFEGDTSLTRNDYFLANGDDYSYNSTLFAAMTDTTGGNYDLPGLALYRYNRYQESLATNPNFYYGPKSLLLYGAASFLYELFPSSSNGNSPDLPTISSFFGAGPASNNYAFTNKEKIPDDWYNRQTPYTIQDVSNQIGSMYLLHPVLFGGNVGPGNFDALDTFGSISEGKLDVSANSVTCLLYQLATENVPSGIGLVDTLTTEVVNWTAGKLNPAFKNFGCPLKI